MALSRAGCCRVLWRLGPGPGPAAGLSRARRPLELPLPPRWAPRSLVCRLSTKAGSRSILTTLASKAKLVSGRYERFLERTFPRFYVLYTTFTKGIQALFLEVKEIRKIKSKMSHQRLSVQQLPYREMERLRQFRRDVIKAIPIGIIAIPPFANFLVIVLMYFFPRQLLIRYFWTPRQQVEFLDAYDAVRRGSYPHVLASLALAARSLPEPQLREGLQELCAEVQRGRQPRVAQLYALRSLFAGSPLALSKLRVSHVKALSQVLFLTPHLPAFFLRHRLRSHVLEIRHLDRAMLRLGVGQLSEEELRAACYLRGLNSTHLGVPECRAWLEQWLGLSCKLQASEASLLANSMVLLSLNYVRAKE
ncbi:LETM1 domain-containing protein 1 [Falco biarmicus]|uniref:LETM1 domain-containing protein 1 n=1 Tax=Falco biarmicus TaxID=345155 RepID=UPI0018867EB4|nr:LETM1 domain-containing protein 1 isoform X2 [Falco rusticolus]XP_055552430.1 LETM1 domain-containing protein 1 isoform X1 [Falco cherrug]XP_056177863.1 LETM1 domain-containing protein 1 [Falco biarmicus]